MQRWAPLGAHAVCCTTTTARMHVRTATRCLMRAPGLLPTGPSAQRLSVPLLPRHSTCCLHSCSPIHRHSRRRLATLGREHRWRGARTARKACLMRCGRRQVRPRAGSCRAKVPRAPWLGGGGGVVSSSMHDSGPLPLIPPGLLPADQIIDHLGDLLGIEAVVARLAFHAEGALVAHGARSAPAQAALDACLLVLENLGGLLETAHSERSKSDPPPQWLGGGHGGCRGVDRRQPKGAKGEGAERGGASWQQEAMCGVARAAGGRTAGAADQPAAPRPLFQPPHRLCAAV